MLFCADVTYTRLIQANLTPHLKWPPGLKKAWPQSNLTPHIVHVSRATSFHFLHLPRSRHCVCLQYQRVAGPSSKVTPTFLHFHTCDENQGWGGGKISIYILHARNFPIGCLATNVPVLAVRACDSAKRAYDTVQRGPTIFSISQDIGRVRVLLGKAKPLLSRSFMKFCWAFSVWLVSVITLLWLETRLSLNPPRCSGCDVVLVY